MQPIETPGVATIGGLRQQVEVRAAAEATTALRSAAARETSGFAKELLAAAAAVLNEAGLADDASAAQLRELAASTELRPLLRRWVLQLREAASAQADTGACTIGSALDLWSWTAGHLSTATAFGAGEELAEALAPLLAARAFALEVARPGESALRRDLAHAYAARAAARAGGVCAELVFGYRQHLNWDAGGCDACFSAEELDDLESIVPGAASGARSMTDVVEADGSHPAKEGPCARFDGLETFVRLRQRLDGCLTGARIAKDRAAAAMARSGAH